MSLAIAASSPAKATVQPAMPNNPTAKTDAFERELAATEQDVGNPDAAVQPPQPPNPVALIVPFPTPTIEAEGKPPAVVAGSPQPRPAALPVNLAALLAHEQTSTVRKGATTASAVDNATPVLPAAAMTTAAGAGASPELPLAGAAGPAIGSLPNLQIPTLQIPTPQIPAFHEPNLSPSAPSGLVAAKAAPASATLDALPVAIAAQLRGGTQQFTIRLDPAELGEVEVRLAIASDGTARAHLIVERPATLHQLSQDAPRLEQALSAMNAGDNAGVSFSLKQDFSKQRDESGAPAGPALTDDETAAPAPSPAHAWRPLATAASRLDMMA